MDSGKNVREDEALKGRRRWKTKSRSAAATRRNSELHLRRKQAKKASYVVVPEKASAILCFIPPCRCILDLGCGDGIYLPILASKAEDVIGLDISVDRCKTVRKRGFHTVVGDALHLPLKTDCVDAVWSSEAVEHLPSLEAFNEIERVARDIILATIPNPLGPFYWMDETHILRYSVQKLVNFLDSRRGWKYVIKGLGLSTKVGIPKWLKMAIYRLTFNTPYLAFDLLLLGRAEER